MWVQLVIVTLLAAVAQGIAGFSFTLLAVSFFLVALGSTDAVQLVIVINFAISVVLVARLWRAVPLRLWALLAGGGMLGFPLGLWVFARADLGLIELAVALVTIGFAAAVAAQEARPVPLPAAATVQAPPYRPVSAVAIGVAAGALTSSVGAPGPPVALYLTRLRLDKTTFRGLAMATFIVMQIGSLVGQVVYVGVGSQVWRHAVVLVPVAALGAAMGHGLCRYVSERTFRRVVLALLFATGGYMLYRSLSG